MYRRIRKSNVKNYNRNHFGFEGMEIAEHAQYTEYSEGGFYNWHVDSFLDHPNQPPVRKISMSCLFYLVKMNLKVEVWNSLMRIDQLN